MSKVDILGRLGGREKAALFGWLVGIISTLGYAVLYLRVHGGSFGTIFKMVFIYIGALDLLAKRLEPDFSLTFTLLYSFKFAPSGFLIMLVYLGLLGAGLGVLLWSVYGNLKRKIRPTSQ
jgi:hypothetical protein